MGHLLGCGPRARYAALGPLVGSSGRPPPGFAAEGGAARYVFKRACQPCPLCMRSDGRVSTDPPSTRDPVAHSNHQAGNGQLTVRLQVLLLRLRLRLRLGLRFAEPAVPRVVPAGRLRCVRQGSLQASRWLRPESRSSRSHRRQGRSSAGTGSCPCDGARRAAGRHACGCR